MARILIIEDERTILSLLQRIVTHLGHEGFSAPNGTAGLALIEEIDPHLIISDLRMPGAPSGLDLIRAIREQCPKTPLVVISGYASREFMTNWPDLGIDEFLAKPFDMGAIREVINRLLQRSTLPTDGT